MTNPYEAPVADGSPPECRLPVRHARLFVLAAGISLLPFLWIAVSVDKGNPTWWKPFPMIALVVTFLLKSKIVAFLCATLVVLPAFALFNWPLLNGKSNISKWSVIFRFLHVLNGIYLMASIPEGVRHLGRMHTVAVCSVTFVLFAGLVILWVQCMRRPSFQLALVCQWLAWFWLILYSFPLLGPLFTLI